MDILIFSILTNFLYYCSGRIFLSDKKSDIQSQFYIYFIGIISISTIALFFNFFTKLDQLVNSLIYVFIIFIFFLKNKFNFNKNNFYFLIISSIITFLLIIFSTVNRPDAGLYHLPFVSILNEHKIILGVSNIHFRFGHTSIIQYLSAINYNFFFNTNGISIPLASVASIFYIYFGNDIYLIIKKKEIPDISKIFSLFILIYISYKMIRYSSFGNDAVAHFTFFYLFSYILKNKLNKIKFEKCLIISTFIFINKTTMGIVFIIPIIIFFYNEGLKFKKILKIILSPGALILYMWLIKNILISGCAIFPMKITCLNNLAWTDTKEINRVYVESQAWSKGWPDRLDKNIQIDKFNKNFNWTKAWINKHFKYILNVILPYSIILIIVTYIIRNKFSKLTKNNFKDLNKRLILLISTSGIGVISFILIFPIYRYGYSFIISLISLILIYFIKNDLQSYKNNLLFKTIFIMTILVFFTKQSQKIHNNFELSKWPNIYTLNVNNIKNNYKKIKISDNFYYFLAVSGDQLCMYSSSPCTSYLIEKKIKHLSKYGYSLIVLE